MLSLLAYAPTGPSVAGRIASAARLEQKPGAPLGLVDQVLQQARGGHVAVLVAQVVRLAHTGRKGLVVVAKLTQHVERVDVVRVVVENAFEPRSMTERSQRRAADFAYTLSQGIRCREDLLCLLVEQ